MVAALAGAVAGALLVLVRPGEWLKFDPVFQAHPVFWKVCAVIWGGFSL